MGMFRFCYRIQFILLFLTVLSSSLIFAQGHTAFDSLSPNERILKGFQDYVFPQKSGDAIWVMNFNRMPVMEANVILRNSYQEQLKVEKDLIDGLYLFGDLPVGLYRVDVFTEAYDTLVFRFEKQANTPCRFKLVNSLGEIHFYPTEFGFFPFDRFEEMLHFELDSMSYFLCKKDSFKSEKTKWFLEKHKVDLKTPCFNTPRNEGVRKQFYMDLDSTFLKVVGLNVLGRCDEYHSIQNDMYLYVDALMDEYELRAVLNKFHFDLLDIYKEHTLGSMPLLLKIKVNYIKPLSMEMLSDLKNLYLGCPVYRIQLRG
jgi:hypothetical protein